MHSPIGGACMYWLFTDETNKTSADGDFFIYGGIAIPADRIAELHNSIEAIRAEFGFAATDQLKFQTASRPATMTIETWRKAKSAVIDAALHSNCQLMAYFIHHGIAAPHSDTERMHMALNALIAHYDMRFLANKESVGAVCIDRLDSSGGFDYLRDRFQKPLDLPDGREPKLERIVHYSISCDGASHMSSVVDVVLGAFRYCVNAASGSGNDEVARQLIPRVVELMWSMRVGDEETVSMYGYLPYPRTIKSPVYAAAYASVHSRLDSYLQGRT